MISPSKLVITAAAVLLGVAMVGCGSSDAASSASTPPVDAATAAKTQAGDGGKKAAAGGGIADTSVVPGKPGDKGLQGNGK